MHGNGYVVTWAIGHLVSLAQPHEIHPEWKQWSFEHLPMLPQQWPLVVYESSKSQFEVVKKILSSARVKQVVCATDAGREGELIFRYIYEAAQCNKPCQRLWISSMTAEAIRKGFDSLRSSAEYDSLADAAQGRSRADWLVGMNLSRAYSLLYREDLSVGRVQTPTLAMLVERELAVRNFKSEEYIEILARFEGVEGKESYNGIYFVPRAEQSKDQEAQAKNTRLPADGEEAKRILERAKRGQARIESISSETQRQQSPLLYDLTELQRHANRLYGFSAQQTLTAAQALYEKHKLISYPRTDSRHISADLTANLRNIARAVAPAYPQMIAEGTGERALGKRYVDDSKVTDHHAILPNAVSASKLLLGDAEKRIYDLVCRRFLMMWHEDYVQAVTTVITAISAEEITDRYQSKGTQVLREGWKILDLKAEKKKRGSKESDDEKEADQVLPPSLAEGQLQRLAAIEAKTKKTKPSRRFTEGTLLTAMQTAGESLDEKELSEAMKETGLGTPATRAGIIEVLLKRGYMVRSGKTLEATEKGIHLIEVVHPEVKTPAMTGQWEAFLKKIQHGDAQLDPFLAGIHTYVRDVVEKVRHSPRKRIFVAAKPEPALEEKPAHTAKISLKKLLKDSFGFDAFLPRQEATCKALLAQKDVLLSLPAGAGKSLCWQLAGLAMSGSTLVFHEDSRWLETQCEAMRKLGKTAAFLHAGQDRDAMRAACVEYLSGRLDYFFIAPERFRVEGFAAMLAKRKPALLAVECAERVLDADSDYAVLAKSIELLKPASILAILDAAPAKVRKRIEEAFALQKDTEK